MKLVAIVVGLTALAVSASAQPSTSPDQKGANTSGNTGSSATAPAVIHPGNPDPGMAVKPPAMGVTPVVPPPGTMGNNPTVVPK